LPYFLIDYKELKQFFEIVNHCFKLISGYRELDTEMGDINQFIFLFSFIIVKYA